MSTKVTMRDVAERLVISTARASKAIGIFIEACGELESASPRNNTVDIRPNADGTTSLHIDKTQVRLRFGAESEEKVEIVLEPREQT